MNLNRRAAKAMGFEMKTAHTGEYWHDEDDRLYFEWNPQNCYNDAMIVYREAVGREPELTSSAIDRACRCRACRAAVVLALDLTPEQITTVCVEVLESGDGS